MTRRPQAKRKQPGAAEIIHPEWTRSYQVSGKSKPALMIKPSTDESKVKSRNRLLANTSNTCIDARRSDQKVYGLKLVPLKHLIQRSTAQLPRVPSSPMHRDDHCHPARSTTEKDPMCPSHLATEGNCRASALSASSSNIAASSLPAVHPDTYTAACLISTKSASHPERVRNYRRVSAWKATINPGSGNVW